jgi:hypothetical protein
MSKNKVVTIFTVFLVFVLFIAMKPGDNPIILMRVASIAAAIIFLGMILYTRILWRIAPFNKLHKVIDIGGKWQGKILMNDGEAHEVDAHIFQYLDDIKIKVKTNDFYNDSLSCKMRVDSKGSYLYVVYRSKPNGKVDSKSQIEYGTFIIKCDEDFLEGMFYSSSSTSGKVELYRK